MPVILQGLAKNIIDIFRGRNLLWHILAIALTATIVLTGFDWSYFCSTRAQTILSIAFPAVVLGGLIPIFWPLVMLLIGALKKDEPDEIKAWILGQAGILGWLISSFYKSLTGRMPPPLAKGMFNVMSKHTAMVDISHNFQFGFMKGGIFWGWPSSHTTVAFAMSVCFFVMYPKHRALGYIALLYALYIGLGISVTIHWFSEFVAGAIIGSIIGFVVGMRMRKSEVSPR